MIHPTPTPAQVPAPEASPAGRGLRTGRLVAALLVAAVVALAAAHWDAVAGTAKRGFAAFLVTYEEMYVRSVEEAGLSEYVIFLRGDGDPESYRGFFQGEPAWRLEREGGLPGTLVVTLLGEPREGLERLRAQPFVQMAVRNRGALFCH